MAGKLRHWKEKDGRFYARVAVPAHLRALLGKSELISPLGGDRRAAVRQHPAAVSLLQHQITQAQAKHDRATGLRSSPALFPMTPEQMAVLSYRDRLEQDTEARRRSPVWSNVAVDPEFAETLRRGVAGALRDDQLQELVGHRIERFRTLGNTDAEVGSPEWRNLAIMLCASEYEALSRVVERDEGDFAGQPSNPVLIDADKQDADPVSLSKLWGDYISARTSAGFMKDGGRRMQPVKASLRKFLGHNDARQVTKKNLLDWRDRLLTTLSAKTVSDMYLSAVRSLFQWAHDNERLPENVAASVKQPKPKRQRAREAGYTDAEALTVLKASRSYEPKADEYGRIREKPESVNAKRWVPLICAFTGARVSEITQLRKEDVRKEGDRWVIRVTPEAGTMKAGHYRDVPLHKQVIDEGFLQFVNEAAPGPMFHNGTDPEKFAAKAVRMTNSVGTWLQNSGLVPAGVQPSYAWRHRFKTLARDIGADIRVVDAIQGHAGRTASDSYGDVSVIAKARVIDALPDYKL